ncbi:hypothetical protein J3Q64DRAFT_1645016, partial [Phycomyces blakesleeanus]
RQTYALSLKRPSKYTAERDAPRTLQLCFNIITQWRAAGVNYRENCVFVDEASFHIQTIRSHAWPKRRDPTAVKAHR